VFFTGIKNMQLNFNGSKERAKPFLKWAGGKTQLLKQIHSNLPTALIEGKIDNYIEPFIGGGALFFAIHGTFGLKNYTIVDNNPELTLAYRTIKHNVIELINYLRTLEKSYLVLPEEKRKEFFYDIRKKFNSQLETIDYDNAQPQWIERTAWIVFLNRTCFNGLFRVNSKGEFNVPFGRYKNPLICNAPNLTAVSKVLEDVQIIHGDFTYIEPHVNSKSFVYFDPPYRPLSKTASFTAYSKSSFNDESQLSLASFYRKLDKKSAFLMLSNSDPKNADTKDNFFDDAFQGFQIKRVKASRNINSKATSRGKINELLIMNY
jgi:DNA adenine methylase